MSNSAVAATPTRSSRQPWPLPITVVCGPAAATFSRSLAAKQSSYRLGVLASANSDWESGLEKQRSAKKLIVYRLPSSGFDPREFTRQVDDIANDGAVDRLLIELHPRSHPAPLALLLRRDDEQRRDKSETATIPQLSSVVMSVDAASLCDIVAERPRQSESQLLIAEQLEFADTIALIGRNAAAESNLAKRIAASLNPYAKIIETSHDEIGNQLLASTVAFSYETAFGGGWAESAAAAVAPDPDDHTATGGFHYGADRPFHPARFSQLLQQRLPGVFRAKGLFWLASRPHLAGGLNIAGGECQLVAAGRWQSSSSDDEHHPPCGDPRQAISFLGIDLDATELCTRLDACLLTDDEMALGRGAWASFYDPLPSSAEEPHHHVGCGHHGCCGH